MKTIFNDTVFMFISICFSWLIKALFMPCCTRSRVNRHSPKEPHTQISLHEEIIGVVFSS
ncbi:hypothetical protein [Nostoc sp. UHCC 0870]|uniref:hypothetical protein n=1 Tax=Nostoc sp. UHCC 0870 TaxID=2914041 RepID=UPI0030DBAFC0